MSDIRFNRWLHQSGTGGVYQDSAGNVGIGTSVPTTLLDIQGGNIKIGSNTLSSSGVSTFSNIVATSGSLTGITTIGVTTVTATSLNVNGNDYPSAGPLSNRNRWINGAMTIDQRRAGSSKTNAAGNDYVVDRLRFEGESSKCTIGQNLNSVTPPVGFKSYAGVEVTTTHTPTSSQQFNISRWIEGYNVADFELGTANAKQFTISFWVRSSVTGTYGLSLLGYDGSSTFRSYIREYTIDSANTWEYKTLTIQGDTSTAITWGTTNDAGLFVSWALGVGSGLTTTADTWTTGLYRSTSNQTNLFATNGATFYLTGVQVEVGSVATPFEHRSYGDELTRCERYYQVYGNVFGILMHNYTSGQAYGGFPLRTPMRANAAADYILPYNDAATAYYSNGGAAKTLTALALNASSTNFIQLTVTGTLGTGGDAGHLDINSVDAIKLQAEL